MLSSLGAISLQYLALVLDAALSDFPWVIQDICGKSEYWKQLSQGLIQSLFKSTEVFPIDFN